MRRDIVNEITDLKGRNEFSERYSFILRFYALEVLLKSVKESMIINQETLKYIPIALVACFEGFFRATYAEIIDKGEPYSSNLENFNKNIKLDFSIFNAIQGKKLSIGEFISHALPCNRLNDIDKNMSTLLGLDFFYELENFTSDSIFADSQEISEKFKNNYDDIKRSITRVFELRHIFCHEFGIKIEADKEEIEILFEDSRTFLEHVNEFVWHILCPNSPETQTDMNQNSADYYANLDRKLTEYIDKIKNHEFFDGENFDKSLLDKSISKWKEYREITAQMYASVVDGGSMYPMMYTDGLALITQRKLSELEEDYAEVFI